MSVVLWHGGRKWSTDWSSVLHTDWLRPVPPLPPQPVRLARCSCGYDGGAGSVLTFYSWLVGCLCSGLAKWSTMTLCTAPHPHPGVALLVKSNMAIRSVWNCSVSDHWFCFSVLLYVACDVLVKWWWWWWWYWHTYTQMGSGRLTWRKRWN